MMEEESAKAVAPLLNLLIGWQNMAGTTLSPSEIKMAQQEAQRFFPGVNLQWKQIGRGIKPSGPASTLNMSFLRQPTSDMKNSVDAWGSTFGRNAYVFSEPWRQAFAGKSPIEADRILGQVIVHELGHALGLQHSEMGIMSPKLHLGGGPIPGFSKSERAALIKRIQAMREN